MSASHIIPTRVFEYTWVRRVILSCIDKDQLESAYKLIDIYDKKYDDWNDYQMLLNTASSHKLTMP